MTRVTSGRVPPRMSDDTRFFWDGCAEGRLLLQRCSACLHVRHPPGPTCPRCHSFDWDTVQASGSGRVYSYASPHYPLMPGFDDPYVVVLVELDDYPVRILADLVDAPAGGPAIDDAVQLRFLAQDEGWTAPVFRLVR